METAVENRSLVELGKPSIPMPPQEIQITENFDGAELHAKPVVAELMQRLKRGEFGHLPKDSTGMDEFRADRERAKLFQNWRDFIVDRGKRYEECRLSNYEATTPSQAKAVARLTRYVEQFDLAFCEGQGVVLFGAKGTGKDHLAVAVCREIIRRGRKVQWVNGLDLYGMIRDRIGSVETERDLLKRFVNPDVLYISDPTPPAGILTEFQSAMLFRILDARYSRQLPCIVTGNFADGTEMEARVGPQNADRIKDGAVAIFCDWPSYRSAKQ